ncbi:MAG: ABC transporter substrate-binding protein/permease [Puniceicoccales bacterium]|jgi:polar amino acid transport system substrate-binding protein|nr:ABC transporter substrate-binding protein/permease [Puniceicoccales bacterium]
MSQCVKLIFLTHIFGIMGCVLGDIKPLTTLRWGADVESGVPNVFYDPQQPSKITGFEFEIAAALATIIHAQLEFHANDWEMLVPGLQRHEYDILLNGIERNTWQHFTNKAGIQLSIPYYITHLQLVVASSSPLKNFSECEDKTIGILKQSWHAEKTLKRFHNTQIVIYDDEVKAFADLSNKRLDGVLLDHPESFYYAAIDKNVRLIDDPISRLEYSVMVRAEDTDLLEKINKALSILIHNGQLRFILERWNLWNTATAAYFHATPTANSPAIAFDQYVATVQLNQKQWGHFYLQCLPILGKAAWTTLKLSLIAMFFAMIAGFSLAVVRTYATGPIRLLVTVYVECVRGIPLLIQLLFIFYGLPTLSKHLPEPMSHWICFSPFLAGVIALAINYSAYECEIYRAGLLSVPRGQMEAAKALGMSHIQALWHVIFPQAIRMVVPPVTNDFIMLLQDSSLVSMITIVELTRAYQYLAATNFNYFGTGLLVAGFYLAIGFPFVYLARRFENRFNLKKYPHK